MQSPPSPKASISASSPSNSKRGGARSARREERRLVFRPGVGDDRIAQRAETIDLDLADIARLHLHHALDIDAAIVLRGRLLARMQRQRARRARDDDVARTQIVSLAQIIDELRHAEDHEIERRILALDTVDPGDDAVLLPIAELVRRHQPRTEAARLLEILAEAELAIMALIFADGAFVVAGIAGDMIERLLDRDVAPAFADDDGELALVFVFHRDLGIGAEDRAIVPDLRARHAQEDLRIFPRGGEAGLVDVELVVEREAPDRLRVGDHRIEGDAGEAL